MGPVKTTLGDPSVKRCIDAFYDAFVRRHNQQASAESWIAEKRAKVPVAERSVRQADMTLPLINGAKDGALMKKLLAAYGEDRVLSLIEDFFGRGYATWGVGNSSQDVGAFFSAAPRLLVRNAAPRQQPRRTQNNLDAAARAMGQTPRADRLQLPENSLARAGGLTVSPGPEGCGTSARTTGTVTKRDAR